MTDPTPPICERFGKFRQFPGLHQLSLSTLDRFELLLRAVEKEVARPQVHPTMDGGIQASWGWGSWKVGLTAFQNDSYYLEATNTKTRECVDHVFHTTPHTADEVVAFLLDIRGLAWISSKVLTGHAEPFDPEIARCFQDWARSLGTFGSVEDSQILSDRDAWALAHIAQFPHMPEADLKGVIGSLTDRGQKLARLMVDVVASRPGNPLDSDLEIVHGFLRWARSLGKSPPRLPGGHRRHA